MSRRRRATYLRPPSQHDPFEVAVLCIVCGLIVLAGLSAALGLALK